MDLEGRPASPGKRSLAAFSIRDITRPLTLSEQEALAHKLVSQIVEDDKIKRTHEQLPQHLEDVRKIMDSRTRLDVKLPIFSQLSPRTKRKLAALPRPNEFELQQVRNLERKTKEVGAKEVYRIIPDPKKHNELEKQLLSSTEIIESQRSLVPGYVDTRQIGKSTTKVYEASEKYKRRKEDQTRYLAELFADENSTVVSPTKPGTSNSSIVSGNTNSQGGMLSRTVSRQNTASTTSSHVTRGQQRSPSPEASPAPMMLTSSSATSFADIAKTVFDKQNKPVVSSSKHNVSKPLASSTVNFQRIGYNSLLAPAPLSSSAVIRDLTKSTELRSAMHTPSVTSAEIESKQQKRYLKDFSARVQDEMGIDLDAEYNRLRRHRHILQVWMLHLVRGRKRAGLQRWYEVAMYLRQRRLTRAAGRIYRAIQGGIHWRMHREKIRYEQLQQADAERRRLENEAFIDRKARIITTSFRRYVRMLRIKYLLKLRRSATHIQRIVRGRAGRLRFQQLWSQYQHLRISVTLIQSIVRMRLAYRRTKLRRKMLFVAEWMAQQEAIMRSHRVDMSRSGAASYVARAYRHHLITNKLRRLIHWNHYAKAIVIQRYFRGHRTRKVFRVRLHRHRQNVTRQIHAAIVLQKYIRRFLAEALGDRLFAEKEDIKQQRHAEKLFQLARGPTIVQRCRHKLWRLHRKMFLINRHLFLAAKATTIQRIWRGHHGRQRMFFVRMHVFLRAFNRRFRQRTKACLQIQRIYRGYAKRQFLRRQAQVQKIVRIQCLMRVFLAHRRLQRLRKQHNDARRVTRIVRRLIYKHRFHQRFVRERYLGQHVVPIQCLFRGCLARKRVRAMSAKRLRIQELNLAARTHILQLLAAIQCKLLHETITKPMQQRYYVVSRQDCLCFGPLQALFVLGLCRGSRTRIELRVLNTHKLDNQSLLKYLTKLEGFLQLSFLQKQALGLRSKVPPNGVYYVPAEDDVAHHQFRAQTILSDEAFQQPLLALLTTGDIPLPPVTKTISSTELDLIFAKSKSSDNVTHKLTYPEFLSALEAIAKLHYTPKQPKKKTMVAEETAVIAPEENGEDDDEEDGEDADDDSSSVLADDAASINPDTAAQQPDEDPAADIVEPATVDEPPAPMNLQQFLDTQVQQINHNKHLFSAETLSIAPSHLLTGTDIDLRFALVVRLLYNFQQEPYVQEVLQWLDLEAKARLALFVVRIQCLVRKKLARVRVTRRRVEVAEEAYAQRLRQHLVKAQALLRAFLHRRRVMKLAQRTLIRYVPYLKEAYWYNPVTQVQSFTKPKILGHLDAFSIALPEEGLEYMIACYNCTHRAASVYCQECEDSMCQVCFDSLHCKGQRRQHQAVSIPLCVYCQGRQMATKACVTCVIQRPRSDSYRASIEPASRRALYCDTCFLHEHDQAFYKSLETHKAKRQAYATLMHHSQQAMLVQSLLQQRIVTKHTYESLVQTCEECQQFSAAWRCFDCEQVYCARCLVVFHQLHPKFRGHRIEQLPYYTHAMHLSYCQDVAQRRFTYKWDKCLLREKRRLQDVAFRAAVKLQAWYRMHYYRRRARVIMKRRRAKQRSSYRLRQREDRLVRSTWQYQWQNHWGRAPFLLSDTREEKVLKRLPQYARERARQYIQHNRSDWVYYRSLVYSAHRRKGEPKMAFDVGEIEELQEQALYGGYRLPGRVLVKENEQIFTTTRNLKAYLRRGELVLINKRLFGVISVEETSIKVSRRWHVQWPKPGDNDEENEDENDRGFEQLEKRTKIAEKKKKNRRLDEDEGSSRKKTDTSSLASSVDSLGSDSQTALPKGTWSYVMYRVPTYADETAQWYYKMHYNAYEYTVQNPIYQVGLQGYKAFCQRMIQTSLYFYHMNQRNRMPTEAREWKASALLYAQRVKSVNAKLSTGDAFVDLSTIKSPYNTENNQPIVRPILLEDQEEWIMLQSPQRRSTNKAAKMRQLEKDRRKKAGLASSDDEDSDSDDEDSEDDALLKERAKPKKAPMFSPSGKVLVTDGESAKSSKRRQRNRGSSSVDASSPKKPFSEDEKDEDEDKEKDQKNDQRTKKKRRDEDDDENDDSDQEDDGNDGGDDFAFDPEEAEMESRKIDYDTEYVDPDTGERTISAQEIKRRKREERIREKRTSKKKSKKILKPQKAWFATREQEDERRAREDKMTLVELAMEAGEWKEEIDVMTENIYFININTNEMMTTVPRAVAAKKQIEFENSRKKRDFDIALQRINRLDMETKNRLLITGGRKK